MNELLCAANKARVRPPSHLYARFGASNRAHSKAVAS